MTENYLPQRNKKKKKAVIFNSRLFDNDRSYGTQVDLIEYYLHTQKPLLPQIRGGCSHWFREDFTVSAKRTNNTAETPLGDKEHVT